MLKSIAGAFLFGAGCLATEAAPAFEGRYVSGTKDYRQELVIKRLADGRFNVTAVVGTQGCAGQVPDAIGVEDGNTLKVAAREDTYTCMLVIRRTKTGVSVKEGDGCTNFHGPSCEVSGDYHKRR